MTPANPLAWILAGLAVPVFAAYLHMLKRTPKHVPSALLYRRIAGKSNPTRRALAKPRHLVSLIMVLIALLGLVAALADLRSDDDQPHDYVAVLDTSASMGVRPTGGDTRLDDAVAALERATGAFGPGDRVALITTGAVNTVHIGLTEDHGRVLEIARRQTAAGSSAAAPEALEIADAMAAQSDNATIVLLSDGVGVSVPTMDHAVEHLAVGRVGDNAGINALAVREADALGLAEVFVSITSDLGEAREAEVALKVDETIVDVLSVDLPAHGTVEKLHRVQVPEGDVVIAQLQRHGEDLLPADDIAVTPRRSGDRVAVLLVTRTRVSFTAEALALHPRVDLTVVGPHDPASAEGFDLIVLETPYRAAALPDAQHVLAMGVPPETVGLKARGRVPSPEILRWSFDHPLFRFVDLSSIELPRATALAPSEGQLPLIDSGQGPIAVLTDYEDRKVAYFGFLPQESDLVLRVGFVNLIANVVEWSGGAAPEPEPEPETETEPEPEADPLPPIGVLPASETKIDPPAALENTSRGDFGDPLGGDRPLWHWLLALGLLVLLAEWMLPLGFGLVGRIRRAKEARA